MVTVILPSGEPYYVGMLYWNMVGSIPDNASQCQCHKPFPISPFLQVLWLPFPTGWMIVVTVKYLILCKCMMMYYCNLNIYIYISSCICIDVFNVIMSLIGYILQMSPLILIKPHFCWICHESRIKRIKYISGQIVIFQKAESCGHKTGMIPLANNDFREVTQ